MIENGIILGIVVLLVGALPLGLVSIANWRAFGERFDSYRKDYVYLPEEYPDCIFTEWDVTGDRGQRIHVRAYQDRRLSRPERVILWSSGIGADHSPYIPIAAFFATLGYCFIAYDATGSGHSEGKSARGLTQNMLDEKAVLADLQQRGFIGERPFYLMGHSNGGYATLATLNWNTGARAAVVFAAFNDTTDMVMHHVGRTTGIFSRVFLPYVRFLYRTLFGDAISVTAKDGIEKAGVPICFIHSSDDEVVPFSEFTNFRQMPQNERSVFLAMENRQHEAMYRPDVRNRLRPLKKRIEQARSEKVRAELSVRYFEYAKEIDTELMKQIHQFLLSVETE